MTNPVEEFNALSQDLIDGKISEAGFQHVLIDRLGYDLSETRVVIKNLRRMKSETKEIGHRSDGMGIQLHGELHDR